MDKEKAHPDHKEWLHSSSHKRGKEPTSRAKQNTSKEQTNKHLLQMRKTRPVKQMRKTIQCLHLQLQETPAICCWMKAVTASSFSTGTSKSPSKLLKALNLCDEAAIPNEWRAF